MTRSACLIFNPVAGQGNPEQDLSEIKDRLSSEIDLDIRLTTEEVDAGQLAREAVERGVSEIIVSGGDGTISAVAEVSIGTSIPLGILSRGTANAFANALEIPDTIAEACQTILQGKTRAVDAAWCNDRPMVLLAGAGFEAKAVEGAKREVKDRFGVLAYILSGLQQLQELETFEVEITTDEKTIKTLAAAITVANVAPPSSILAQGPAGIIPDDGLLDITIVAPATRAGAIAASYHLIQTAWQGLAAEREDIGYLRSQRVKIATDPPQKVVVDGELMDSTAIEVECVPEGLTVFVPWEEKEPPVEKLEGLPQLRVETESSIPS